ncbi:glycosyltransferase [Microcystis elabens FACHB-917]|nr:glycosyltransferase [Microcystis elabens FACHB-917]
MRLLHFLPVYAPAWQFGGPVLSVSRLCEGLAAAGAEVEVITTNAGLPDWPPDELGVPVWQQGVRVVRYPVDRATGPIRSRALEAALPSHVAWTQLLHLSAVWQPLGLPVQRAAHRAGVPVVHSLRGALGPYGLGRGWWKKWPYFLLRERPLLQRATALHCTSRQEVEELRGLGLRPRRWILPNPLDLSALRCDPALGRAWRARHRLPEAEPLLLIAGRLHHKKGLDLLPGVLGALADRPWRLVVIGNDDDGSGQRLRRGLEQRGLAERCLWLPALPAAELLGPYNAADLLLLPSRHENFGNVVVEAMACGCGAMVTPRVGVGGDGAEFEGLQVVERRREAWIEALAGWLRQPRRPGAPAALAVAERYSSETIAREALAVYAAIRGRAISNRLQDGMAPM